MARAATIAEADALPEPDRLDEFPHPRNTRVLFGQSAAEQIFLDAYHSGRPHHAWLLTGPEGVGKATLAWRIARFLLAGSDAADLLGNSLDIDPTLPRVRQVASLSNPDLLLIRRPYDYKAKKLKTEITVDEVRRIKGFLSLMATNDSCRVVIVDPADDLNANAANALLKSLEEPPSRTILLLISSAPGRLLPTLRSRCRTLAVQPLEDEPLMKAVAQALTSADSETAKPLVPVEDRAKLISLSDGSVRRALTLYALGGLAIDDKIGAVLKRLPAVDWAAAHQLGDELSGAANEAQYRLFFELLLARIARMAKSQQSSAATAFARAHARIVADMADSDALNLDRKALILAALSHLEAASRG